MDVDQRVCMLLIVQTYSWTRGSLCIQITPVDNSQDMHHISMHSTCLAQVIRFASLTTPSSDHNQTGESCTVLSATWPTLHVGPLQDERLRFRRVGKHRKKSCTLVRSLSPRAPVMHKSKLLMQVLAQVQDKEPMDRFRFIASDRVGALPNSQECEGQVRS